jgi:hypothetical protein
MYGIFKPNLLFYKAYSIPIITIHGFLFKNAIKNTILSIWTCLVCLGGFLY